MSSLFFFVISPIMLYLLHPYARERNLAVHLVWTMMIFVGVSSLSLPNSRPTFIQL
jgi:alkaline ceramidase